MTEQLYAVAPTYALFVEALCARREELNVSFDALDDATESAKGTWAKYLGPSQTKKFGMISLEKLLPRLGLRLVLETDQKALAAAREELDKRQANCVRKDNYARPSGMRIKRRVFHEMGKRGGPARMRKMTETERSKFGARAANIRWNKDRKRRKAERCAPHPANP